MHKYTPETAIINKGDLKRTKIVFTENKRVYECINDTNENILMLHVDGELFSATDKSIRCDYAFEADGKLGNRTCLVELKGHNISHACEQLYQTLDYFEKKYPVSKFFCRIVTSGSKKPNIESKEEKLLSAYLKRKHYAPLKTGTNKICEKLSDLK